MLSLSYIEGLGCAQILVDHYEIVGAWQPWNNIYMSSCMTSLSQYKDKKQYFIDVSPTW